MYKTLRVLTHSEWLRCGCPHYSRKIAVVPLFPAIRSRDETSSSSARGSSGARSRASWPRAASRARSSTIARSGAARRGVRRDAGPVCRSARTRAAARPRHPQPRAVRRWIDAVRRESGIDVEYRRIGTLEVALDAAARGGAATLRAGYTPEPRRRGWTRRRAAQHPALGVDRRRAVHARARLRRGSPARAGARARARNAHGRDSRRRVRRISARTPGSRVESHGRRAHGRQRRPRRRRLDRCPSTASARRRCGRCAVSCCTSGGTAAARDDRLGTRLLHRAADRRHVAGRRDGRRRRFRRADDRGRRRAICWTPSASCCPEDGARRFSRRAPACGRRRPTSCRCSAQIPPSRGSSTPPGTTATACCSRRSRR